MKYPSVTVVTISSADSGKACVVEMMLAILLDESATLGVDLIHINPSQDPCSSYWVENLGEYSEAQNVVKIPTAAAVSLHSSAKSGFQRFGKHKLVSQAIVRRYATKDQSLNSVQLFIIEALGFQTSRWTTEFDEQVLNFERIKR